ncbi:MAG: hypothetical protein OJF49_000272 [Ktedonobacterales bacterium]|jgi:hypothetical protein|nr:MAG: hypothetical protein OJF49_000272 [Ktedonobacterales bacterium]
MGYPGRGSSGETDTNDTTYGDGMRLGWDGTPEREEMPAEAMAGEMGEPLGVVEIVTVETTEVIPTGETYQGMAAREPGPRFRWWYIPAVVAPVAAGVAGGVLLWQRRQPVSTTTRLSRQAQRWTRQGQRWMRQTRRAGARRNAAKNWQSGMRSVRATTQTLPTQAAALRDRSAAMLTAVDLAALRSQATNTINTARGQMRGYWKASAATRAQMARAAQNQSRAATRMTQEQARRLAFATGAAMGALTGWRAGQRAGATTTKATISAKQARRQTAKTARAVRKTARKSRNSVRGAWLSASAFTLGALVAAIVTYVRIWGKRMTESETSETASGLASDTTPTYLTPQI